MEGKNKLKEIDIKNRTCHYFDNINKIEDFYINIVIDEKPYKNVFFNNISYKTLIDSLK